MPSDANGVFSLLAGYLAVPGAKVTPSQHNPVFEDVATALSGRLLKNGNTAMTGPLQGYGGNVATPGYTFDGAENFGFFKTANGIGVSVNGVQVVEFTASGVLKSSRYMGELIPWTRATAPPLCVLPFGQTLSRTTYADLWVVAQAEIAVGNTFYNNGDGSTTFGIGDLRGRTIACKDDMGGSAASRLTSTYFGTSAAVLGAAGGSQSHTMTLGELPTGITSANTGTVALSVTSTVNDILRGGASDNFTSTVGSGQFNSLTKNTITSTGNIGVGAAAVTSNNTGGNPHSIASPSLIINFALFAGV
jgi:microcystin-dependent protein